MNSKEKKYIPLSSEVHADLCELMKVTGAASVSRKLSTEEFLAALVKQARNGEIKVKISKAWTVGQVIKSSLAEEKEALETMFNEEVFHRISASLKEKLKETQQADKENGGIAPVVIKRTRKARSEKLSHEELSDNSSSEIQMIQN